MGHHRGDRKGAGLFDDLQHHDQELDSDDELEAALCRELAELSGYDHGLGPKVQEQPFNEEAWPADQSEHDQMSN